MLSAPPRTSSRGRRSRAAKLTSSPSSPGFDTVRVTAHVDAAAQTALAGGRATALRTPSPRRSSPGSAIVVSIYPYGSSRRRSRRRARRDFAQYAASVAGGVPTLHDFIVGNEPNLNRFWLPQFGPTARTPPRPPTTRLLAETYDAMKAVRPAHTSTAARSRRAASTGRTPAATRTRRRPSSPTWAPPTARAAGRRRSWTRFAFHPYADDSTSPPTATHPNSTSIGIADYDKLVALLGKAFDGTAQPGSTLPILYDEFGVEAQIPAAKAPLYTGTEPTTTKPVDEATQAQYYRQALQLAFCQPNVIGLLLFHVVDEPDARRAGSRASTTPTARRRRALAPVRSRRSTQVAARVIAQVRRPAARRRRLTVSPPREGAC